MYDILAFGDAQKLHVCNYCGVSKMINENQVTSKKGLDSFTLKIIAIIGMTLDHTAIAFGDHLPLAVKCLLYAFGGLTYPIMAYLISEGYRHTKNFRNYALRLLIFALVAQIPYSLVLYGQLNILFTLLLGLLALYIIERSNSQVFSAFIAVLFTLVSLFCDWPLMGVPMVLIYYYEKRRRAKLIIPVIFPYVLIGLSTVTPIIMAGHEWYTYLPDILYVLIGCTLTIPLLGNYNGQRGKPAKYFFYVYYPLPRCEIL